MNDSKVDAYDFLDGLGNAIVKDAPRGAAMGPVIRKIVAEAKADERQKHLRLPESAFLNSFAVPVLFKHLQDRAGLTAAQAKEALLNEYHRTMPESSAKSPIRAARHPFKKMLGASAETIYRQWRDPKQNCGLTQSCPDFALQKPI